MQQETEEIRRRWRESAYYWDKHRRVIERMFAPITRALIQKAEIRAGDRVLDLAGGIGEPSLSIAQSFGDTVKITFTDVVQEMVLAARSEVRKRANTSIQFCRCSGDQLPFADASFNVIISRLGIMFFPDAKSSLKHMFRVMNPGGRIALAVWHQRKLNPMYEIVAEVLEQFLPSTPEPLDAPGPFRYSQEGLLESMLKNANFSFVQEDVLDFLIEEPVTFEEFWKFRSEMSDTLRDKLVQLTAAKMNQFYDQLEKEFRPYFKSGKLSIPSKILIVSARKI